MKYFRLLLLSATLLLAGGWLGYMIGFGRGSSTLSFQQRWDGWLLLGSAPGETSVGNEQAKVKRQGDAEVLLAIWRAMDGTKDALQEHVTGTMTGGEESGDPFNAELKSRVKSQVLTAMSAVFLLHDISFTDYANIYFNAANNLNYAGTNESVLGYCRLAQKLGSRITNGPMAISVHKARQDGAQNADREKIIEYLSAGKHISAPEDREILEEGGTYIAWARGKPFRSTLWDWLKNRWASM